MQIFIRPLDTQFHRSGLPFDAGEETEVPSFFPPFPRTIYGALRARAMAESGGFLGLDTDFDPGKHTDIHGDGMSFGNLKIKGPIVARLNAGGRLENSLFFPFPLDLVMEKKSKRMVLLSPSPAGKECGWDLEAPSLSFLDQAGMKKPLAGNVVKSLSGEFFLSFGKLRSYLQHRVHGDVGLFEEGKADALFRPEQRTGIARDSVSRTARESMLYSIRHFRMMDRCENICGFFVSIENHGMSLSAEGTLQIGGDFRAAGYRSLAVDDSVSWWDEHKAAVAEGVVQTGRFKAFYITPALFKAGCVPDIEEWSSSEGGKCLGLAVPSAKGDSVRFELVGACIGKPRCIGGWDIQGRRPKAIRKCVPEGSVYFFQADPREWSMLGEADKRASVEEVFRRYNFRSWCSMEPWTDDGGTEHGPGKEGFGIALIGGW